MEKKNNLYTRLLIAVIMMAMGSAGWAGTRTDVLTPTAIGSYSSYTSWSGKTFESTAVYAGMTNGSLYISIRQTNNNSGIVTTTSGGNARKVTVSWGNMETDKERVINIYGKNSKYSTPTDLFSTTKSTQGTLLGTLKYGTSTSLTISGDYAFIGIRVGGEYTVNLSQISIEWEKSTYIDTPTKTLTTTTFPQNSYTLLWGDSFDAPTATVTANDDPVSSPAVTYESSDQSIATVNASTGEVEPRAAGVVTITATYAGNDTYQESSASYTLNIQESLTSTWTAASLGYTENTNVETVTNEGDLICITFAQGNGDKQPAYVLSSSAIENKTIKFERYNELSLAAKEGYAISGITIHYQSGSHTFTPSIGSYSVASSTNDWIGTWTGCSPHVTLTNTSGIRLFISSITASYIKLAEAGTVTVTDAGAATYCPTGGQPVVVGDGTLTQIITGVKDGVVTEENIPVVPSGTGVMLHGAGTYKCYTDSRLTEPTIATNYLVGETAGGYVPVGSYALQNQEGEGLGFYPVETEKYTPISAGKAYLTLPSGFSANLRALFFNQADAEHSATAIQSPRFDSHSATTFYNLNGLPLKAPQKGISIMRRADGTIRKVVTP